MKKLFVSVPMKERKEEEIRKSIVKMHKIAEAIMGEKLELIDSYIEHKPPQDCKSRIWYLSKSVEKLATADVLICIKDRFEWNGCYIESEIAHRYGIQTIIVDEEWVMDDIDEIRKKMYGEISCSCME